MKRTWLTAAIFVFILSAPAAQQQDRSKSSKVSRSPAFDWISGLAGDWEGSFQWSGGRSDKGQMKANYYATGHGSAVVENLGDGNQPSMTSVYHPDGPDLRMTHYCGTGIQTRMKAAAIDEKEKSVRFDFVDITNMPNPSAGHVHGFELRIRDANHITLIFRFLGNGVESIEHIELIRKPAN